MYKYNICFKDIKVYNVCLVYNYIFMYVYVL